jgi:hypothetical protein
MMIHVGRWFSPYLASWVLQIICFLSIGCCNWSYLRGDSSQWKHGYSNWLCPMCRTLPWKGIFAVPCSCFNQFVFYVQMHDENQYLCFIFYVKIEICLDHSQTFKGNYIFPYRLNYDKIVKYPVSV